MLQKQSQKHVRSDGSNRVFPVLGLFGISYTYAC